MSKLRSETFSLVFHIYSRSAS